MNTNFYWHIYVIVAKRTCKVFLNIPHSKICNMIQYLPGFVCYKNLFPCLSLWFIQIASVFTAFSRTDPFLFSPLFWLAMHSPSLLKASRSNPRPTFFKLHAKWRHIGAVLPDDFPQKNYCILLKAGVQCWYLNTCTRTIFLICFKATCLQYFKENMKMLRIYKHNNGLLELRYKKGYFT